MSPQDRNFRVMLWIAGLLQAITFLWAVGVSRTVIETKVETVRLHEKYDNVDAKLVDVRNDLKEIKKILVERRR